MSAPASSSSERPPLARPSRPPDGERPRREFQLPPAALTALVAGLVLWLAYDGGSYGVVQRHSLAIVVFWAILLAAIAAPLALRAVPRPALVSGGLLAALTLWTGLSLAWADGAEGAFLDFNRTALYLGIFALAACGPGPPQARRVVDGVALALVGVALVALASRFSPELFPERGLSHFLPGAVTRLNFPVGYWNGLGVLLGMAFPLLLRSALSAASVLVRGLAVASLPGLAAATFLTSSRAGVGAVLLGTFLFVVLVRRRVAALGAIAAAAAGSAAALVVLLRRPELVNGPLDAAVVAGQGRSAALLLAAICSATGLLYAAAVRLSARAPQPGPRAELTSLGGVLLLAAVAVALADPGARFEQLKAPPDPALEASPNYVRDHLLYGTGNGRWELWGSALDQFRTAPLHGRGAGSYEAWWAQHGTLPLFVRDAHSLYLETLGELGVVGLLLLLGAFGGGVVAAAGRLRQATDQQRVLLAALVASFTGFALGAGFDWMWELTIVGLLGAALLGLLVGRGSAPAPAEEVRVERHRTPIGLRFGVAAVALVLIAAATVPLLVALQISASQDAFARRDLDAARSSAAAARTLQPWASSPHLQLALVDEAAERLAEARTSIERAIDRNPSDWRLWLVAARIETKAGKIPEARERLERAMELSPRSSVYADVAR